MTPFDTFQASDKQFAICCGNDHLFGELCRAINRPELAADKRFLSDRARTLNNAALKSEMEAALKKAPAAHWLKVIHEAGVPVAPILNTAEAAEHPQIKARNMWIEAGGVRMPGNPVKISGYEDRRSASAPQHWISTGRRCAKNSPLEPRQSSLIGAQRRILRAQPSIEG
jgi:CoA:oxalate CoA-transferase